MRQFARVGTDSIMDTLDAVLQHKDTMDRIVVITMNDDGDNFTLYSNARSEAEMMGMLLIIRTSED